MQKNLYIEQEKLQKRLEIVSDPKYPAELKRRQQELDARLKTLQREHKQLTFDQNRKEMRLDKIINKQLNSGALMGSQGGGEPEAQKDVVAA